jgi:WD40 repeat protein
VNGGQTTLIPGAYTWNVAFATWSPDGRYIVDPVSLTARIQLSGAKQPSHSSLQQMGLDAAPLVPLRDAGLDTVLQTMPKDTYDPSTQRVLLAWTSDARVLAAYPSSYLVPVSQGGRAATVTIYDTATGSVVRTLTPPQQGIPSFLRVDGALRWSPDGRHLTLYDPGLARLLIWDTSAFAG